MQLIGLIAVSLLLLFGGWLLVRYLKFLQDTSDRRYPESTDDGNLGGDGG